MCNPQIWQDQLGLKWTDNLCLGCLDQRLGRTARFIYEFGPPGWDCPVEHISERLRERLLAAGAQEGKPRRRKKKKKANGVTLSSATRKKAA